jgi:hypothetical protein
MRAAREVFRLHLTFSAYAVLTRRHFLKHGGDSFSFLVLMKIFTGECSNKIQLTMVWLQ